ncbi:MAG: hypothetical protein P8X77_16490 [Maritimibacter sp.]
MSMIRVTYAVFGLSLAALAGWFGLVEYQGFLQRSKPPAEFFTQTDPAQLHFAPTRAIKSNQQQLLFCLNQQKSYGNLLAPEAFQQGFARACLSRAEQILASSPSRGLAHLERADALRRLGRGADAMAALAEAQSTAARENWMALARARIALRIAAGDTPGGFPGNPETVDPTLRDRALDLAGIEIAQLSSSALYADRLAALYRSKPLFSDWFIAIVEQQSEQAQRQFLSAVRRNTGSGS